MKKLVYVLIITILVTGLAGCGTKVKESEKELNSANEGAKVEEKDQTDEKSEDQKIEEILTPTLSDYLSKNGYKALKLKEYKLSENIIVKSQEDMKKGWNINFTSSRPTIIRALDSSKIEYKFIYNALSGLLVVPDDIVIDFGQGEYEGMDVKAIYQIANLKGIIKKPEEILVAYAKESAEAEDKRQEELSNKLVKEQETKEKEQRAARGDVNTISLGMAKEDIMEKWGEPDKVTKTTSKYGEDEVWDYNRKIILYFENGRLEMIKEYGY